ncbi:formate dehydrogenase accessory sulfurtransferase FdhD [Oceanimonas sp. CHS3-5]|uniref:formate dehydrogenase accessory sulfurtransferase FdhD n=1 Tax=Oceanimonas sp. CHS3-5 TaxID=3068186 RepID=UPI00273D2539|nr:formate dehydrogenase accessory sulfurtransferase FdhD [Oceanimonas sp. CHS3-5]MDP5293319.1 formate dehydrogenase accessory sulfurtransferase FdhD [Oceanimonas sp. CHS3-5]
MLDPDTLPDYQFVTTRRGDRHALASEVPLAVVLDGVSHAVMMVSPNQLEEFVTGFLLSEGIIRHHREMHDLEFVRVDDALEARVSLANSTHYRWREHRRSLAGRTGCGLCGIESLAQALPELPALPGRTLPPLTAVEALRRQLNYWQPLGQECGALHAAFYADEQGRIHHSCEDVGRHNALDKLLGWHHRHGPEAPGLVLITSRCSVELVQKMARAGQSTLITLAAPTTLAVRQAQALGLNLLHLPRRQGPRVYSASTSTPECHEQENQNL